MLACFPPGWNGGFHLWRCLGESLGRLLQPVDSPRFKCLGCRFAWSPWLLLYRAVASVTFGWRAATAPVLHTLRQPSFPRKLRLRGCRRCLRFRILSGRSPLGRSLYSVSIFRLVSFYPSGQLVRRLGSLPPIFPFFFFLWSLRHSGVDGKGAGRGLPIGLFLFQL